MYFDTQSVDFSEASTYEEELERTSRDFEEHDSRTAGLREQIQKANRDLEAARERQRSRQSVTSHGYDSEGDHELEHKGSTPRSGSRGAPDDFDSVSDSTESMYDQPMAYSPGSPLRDPVSPAPSTSSRPGEAIKAQEQIRELRRVADREGAERQQAEARRKALEKEKSDLQRRLDEAKDLKCELEQQKLELEARIRTVEYRVQDEEAKRKNAEVLLSKKDEQLRKKEDQYTQEMEARQRAELTVRNLQMESRNLGNSIKQMEDEKREVERSLESERQQRRLAEENARKQGSAQTTAQAEILQAEQLEEKLADTMGRLEEADEGRQQALVKEEQLKTDVLTLKMEVDRLKTRHRDEKSALEEDKDELQEQLARTHDTVKNHEDALAQMTLQLNVKITQLQTDNSTMAAGLEKERNLKEKLETEVDSLKERLGAAGRELTKSEAARNDIERSAHRDREEAGRKAERLEQELDRARVTSQDLQAQAAATRDRLGERERDLVQAQSSLQERTNQLSSLQLEMEARRQQAEHTERDLHEEREKAARMEEKFKAAEANVNSLQHETLSLKQQLELLQEKAFGDSPEKLKVILAQLKDSGGESRSGDLGRVLEQLRDSEQRYAEASAKLARAEAELLETRKSRDQLEGEASSLRREVTRLTELLESATEAQVSAQHRVAELVERLEEHPVMNSTARGSDDEMDPHDLYDSDRPRSRLSRKSSRSSVMDEERRKARRAMEHRKVVENRLVDEMDRNATLEDEVADLRTSLKVAQRRIHNPSEAPAGVTEDINSIRNETQSAAPAGLPGNSEQFYVLRNDLEKTKGRLLEELHSLRLTCVESKVKLEAAEAERSHRASQVPYTSQQHVVTSQQPMASQPLAQHQGGVPQAATPLSNSGLGLGGTRCTAPPDLTFLGRPRGDLDDTMLYKLRCQLDRSVARHMVGAGHSHVATLRSSTPSLLDPHVMPDDRQIYSSVPRSNKHYLNLLQKSFML